MKNLLNTQNYQSMTYTYDTIEELTEDYNKMIEKGWEGHDKEYFGNNKYHQEYIKPL